MRVFVTLILYTFLLENSNSREYHYDKPATPFYSGQANYAQTPANYFPPSNAVPQQSPPPPLPTFNGHTNLPAVIRTYGPTARDFVVSGVKSSHQIFEGRQFPPVPAPHVVPPPSANYQQPPNVMPQKQTHQAKYHTIAPQGVYLPPPPPPGYQQPGKSAHHKQPAQQPGYTARVNPFNHVAYPQGAGGGNYAQTGAYNGGAQQISANYAAPSQQTGGSGGTYGNIGNYVSQSESGQLDGYPYKQINGDSRPFKRIINTCYPNGQCVPSTLDGRPGAQVGDAGHQHFVVSARARTAPASDKCQRIAEAKRAANAYGAPSTGGTSAGSSVAGQSLRPNYANTGYAGQNQNNYATPSGSYGAPQTPNYAAPPTGNYAVPPSGNYAAPQNVPGGNFGGNFGGTSGGNFGSPGINGGFTGAANNIDGDYVAPAAGSGRPDGPVRPLDRRLFAYTEVALTQDPFN